MANLDTTRQLTIQSKRYVAARMQQGRSFLDSDWNEGVQLEAEDLRRTLAELTCAHGSSNAGFSVTDVTTDVSLILTDSSIYTTYDFSLRAGSLFAGGMRFVTDEPGSTFLGQIDWLRVGHQQGNLPPNKPSASSLVPEVVIDPEDLGSPARYDLVYLEAWEQPVTAVEDAELRERALGGPDTSVRTRRMRRIHVAPDIGVGDPPAAFEQLQANLEATGAGVFDGGTLEFASAARLTVTPIMESSEYPCGPKPPSGYIGHEDQAIRVELRDGVPGVNQIVWGFGNAAPLYRVQVGVGATTLTLLNRPRDARLQPKAGQIVELIPWGSRLPNDEKVAEMTGELIRVKKGYDSATGELVLEDPPSTAFVTWQAQVQQGSVPGESSGCDYVYMRLWSRGADVESDPLMTLGVEAVPLGNTGLEVQMTGAGQSGDYWIIAARRATPDTVVPWDLLWDLPHDVAPHGPHRHYAPLAVICWEAPLRYMSTAQKDSFSQSEIVSMVEDFDAGVHAVWGPVRAKVLDARRRLQRLCSGCGTILVGDGTTTSGMVDSIDGALALLPASGGRIHLLPGQHDGEITLNSLQNITITGCSLMTEVLTTVVVAESNILSQQGNPVIEIVDCENITLRDFVVRARSAVGVKLYNSSGNTTNRDIHIDGIRFHTTGQWTNPGSFALSRSAILALGGKRITVENCRVDVTDMLNYVPAMVIGGTELRIRGNYLHAVADDPAEVSLSMGGLQILSFSQDVEITDNVIRGGWGHGVALGHLINLTPPINPVLDLDAYTSWSSLDRTLGDALSNLRVFAPGGLSETLMVGGELWTPGGPVIGVRIRGNRILDKGLSGISTGGFVNTLDSGYVFIVAIDVEIHRNEIVGNMQVDTLTPSTFSRFDVCYGGVCLAAAINLLIHENRIVDNGVDHETPITGVGVVTGQGIVVHDNIIANNGTEYGTPNDEIPYTGMRGGATFGEVTRSRGYFFGDAIANVTVMVPSFTLDGNNVALTVRKNEISQRVGKALWVLSGHGPIVVSENSIHGRGDPVAGSIQNSQLCYGAPAAPDLSFEAEGACVEIRNYASSPLVDYGAGDIPEITFGDTTPKSLEGGPVEFDSNEVSLDWHWLNGYACSVLLSSLDTVKVTNNIMSTNMNSAHVPDDPPAPVGIGPDVGFLADAIAQVAGMSYLLVNCWAGATSTVQASGNRFEESRFDCLFSYLGAHAAAFGTSSALEELTTTAHASMAVMNVGTHCTVPPDLIVGKPAVIVNTDNVAIYEVVTNCAVTAEDDVTGGNQKVCIHD